MQHRKGREWSKNQGYTLAKWGQKGDVLWGEVVVAVAVVVVVAVVAIGQEGISDP